MNANLNELFPRGLSGIVFDVDGVMLDSKDANRFYYNKLLSGLNLPPMTREQEQFAFMSTVKESMLRMTPPQMHQKLDEYIPHAVDYVKDILPKIKIMPGFFKFQAEAHALGLKLAIDTNRTDFGIERVLDFFSIPSYFKPVISSSIAAPKPAADGPRLICEAWQISPGRILFIGDSEDDQKASTGAGMRFAAFGNKDLEGDINAPDYQYLAQILWPFVEKNAKK